MHNISGNVGRKMVFHPDKGNVMSATRNKNTIKFNSTLHGHLLESLEAAK